MIWLTWGAIALLAVAHVLLVIVCKIKFDIVSDVFDLQLDIMHRMEKDIRELKTTVKYMDSVIPLSEDYGTTVVAGNGECLHPNHPEACAYPDDFGPNAD